MRAPVFGRPEQSEAPVPASGGLPHVIVYLPNTWIGEMAIAATALRLPVGDRSSLRPTSTISPEEQASYVHELLPVVNFIDSNFKQPYYGTDSECLPGAISTPHSLTGVRSWKLPRPIDFHL